VWNKNYGGVCALNFISSKGIRFESFTGFKYGQYLITDDSIRKINKPYEIEIAFYKNDGITINQSVKITDKDFKNRILKATEEGLSGFMLVNIDFPQFDEIPSIKLCSKPNYQIASPIAVIGHQWVQNNIAIKTGIVSSYYKHQGIKYIQFDASIERGNSGAPLINVESGEVIGIVGYGLARLEEDYKSLMNVINTNLELLNNSSGKLLVNDIDPIQVLIANQNQIKHIVHELFHKVSFNTGYALNIDQVIEFIDISELEKDIAYANIQKIK